jgi:type VI secretion system secreted protein Hcp
MPYYARIDTKGAGAGSTGGALHGMSHGNTTITPRNFASAMSMVKAQYDVASGQLTGRRQHSPLLVIKKTDSSSPPLFQLASANSVLPSITITILWATGLTGGKIVGRPASGGGETVVARVSLTNASISSIHRYTPSLVGHKSSPHDTNELEEIEFVFQKITFTNLMGSTSASDDWTSNTK